MPEEPAQHKKRHATPFSNWSNRKKCGFKIGDAKLSPEVCTVTLSQNSALFVEKGVLPGMIVIL